MAHVTGKQYIHLVSFYSVNIVKNSILIFIVLGILNLSSCADFGPEKRFSLGSGSRFLLHEHDILTYASDMSIEKFEIIRIVNGEYSDSQSGTCGKPRFYRYDYQAVYMNPIDSAQTDFYFVPEATDDCSSFPGLIPQNVIAFINTSYDSPNKDRVQWMNELLDLLENKSNFHELISLGDDVFVNVFEFKVVNGNRLSTLYYTRAYGFVGYKLLNGTLFTLQL